ncbi:MAG: class I SAM-dependent methyltransferase [Lachnospiraceae bacterium]|nr:class I SAM-dependent methyltransferase [Lachnospiraceae bacterium]
MIPAKTIALSKRLETIAHMVPECDLFTDVGTDHGYLPIWLLSQNICRKACASDINKGPLESAERNALGSGADQDRIAFILSDGLDDVPAPAEGYNVLCIAGMGGPNIRGIMERAGDRLSSYDEYILSPHTGQKELREYLISAGCAIKNERYVTDDEKLYVVIRASRVGSVVPDSSLPDSYFRFGGFVKEALADDTIRAFFVKKRDDLYRIIKEHPDLPVTRHNEIMSEITDYNEVLDIET